MTECDFCGEEFDSEEELHVHWGEEHEDELNSHQKDKAKKARRKKEEKKQKKMARRKKLGGQLLAGTAALIVVGLLGFQFIQNSGSTNTGSFDLEGEPFMGDENASVTVVEFGDYKCPYCKQFDEQVFPQIENEYLNSGDVKFYFVNYAFLGPSSDRAAAAGECVNEQDSEQFWDFHHAIYDNQGSESTDWATTDKLMEIARNSTEGLDYNELEQCISNQETSDEVRSDKRMGDQNEVGGTPTVFVNGEQVQNSMNYGAIKAKIEQNLNSDE